MRKLATIERILEKKPIEGADKIEAVRVREWWVVTKKDEYKVGDSCVYFEIDSFLPIIPPFEFLVKGSSKKRMLVDGQLKEGIRLKTVKLRGQISQGLVMPVAEMTKYAQEPIDATAIGTDVTDVLGIVKYETPMPAELMGKVKGFFPSFIPKTDEERIQNVSEVLSGYYVTEKLDGMSTTFFKKDGVFGVCSRNLEIKEGDSIQWQMAKRYDLANKLPDNFAIQCELVGEGIQKNPLKIKGQDIYCFNVYNIIGGFYLNWYDALGMLNSLGVKPVPEVEHNYTLPNSTLQILVYADGKSLINPEVDREGIVVRPKIEMTYKGKRLSFKVISNNYLLKE